MRHMAMILVAVGVILGAFTPVLVAFGGDNGHTPVTLCHWVPAHGGSFVTITVDDDGSDGNSQLEAHLGHENDIIPAPEGRCDGENAPTVTPTPDTTPSEATPTNTPGYTPGTTPCVEDEVYDAATGECIHIDRISDTDTEPVKLPSTGIGSD